MKNLIPHTLWFICFALSLGYGLAQTPAPPSPEVEKLEEVEDEEGLIVCYLSEQQAEPKGGMKAFHEYIKQNLKYPEQARKAGIEGKVFVQFTVEMDGALTNIKVLKGIGHGCDEEAIRVMQNTEKWKPGRQRDKVIKTQLTIPVVFSLGYEKNFTSWARNRCLPPRPDRVEEIYSVVEKMPEPKEGMTSFMEEYIAQNLKYPKKAQKEGIEGIVYIQFVVCKDGDITDAVSLKGIGYDCDMEAVRVMLASKKWYPGIQRGVPVPVRMVLPINFKLEAQAPDAMPEYKINLYPNPSSKIVNIDLEIPTDEKVQITAHNQRTGKKQVILAQNYEAGAQTFAWEVSNFEADIYILQIKIGEKMTYRRVVVEK